MSYLRALSAVMADNALAEAAMDAEDPEGADPEAAYPRVVALCERNLTAIRSLTSPANLVSFHHQLEQASADMLHLIVHAGALAQADLEQLQRAAISGAAACQGLQAESDRLGLGLRLS